MLGQAPRRLATVHVGEPQVPVAHEADELTVRRDARIERDTFAERLRYEIDPKWQGDIPRTVLIGKDGSARTIEGSAKAADLEKWAKGQGADRH